MYTAVFKDTGSHFLENGSNVYACLLDASSAFDRVHYGKLFDVLMKRGEGRGGEGRGGGGEGRGGGGGGEGRGRGRGRDDCYTYSNRYVQ